MRRKDKKKREGGLPQPWTDDEIFKNARFLNVFREDDRGSKAILRFADNLNGDLETLIQALFFARWCNRQETLDYISSDILRNPEKLLYLLQEKGIGVILLHIQWNPFIGRAKNILELMPQLFSF